MAIYFDHNATTPLDPRVSAFMATQVPHFGNSSSSHQFGREAHYDLETARVQLAQFLDADPDHCIFTSGASESNSQVLMSTFFKSRMAGRPCHVLTTALEHSSVSSACRFLQTQGAIIDRVPGLANGQVDLTAFSKAIHPDLSLISVILVNNETGVIQPIQEMAQMALSHGIPIHVDAVQALGKHPFSVAELGCDFLSLSAHKWHGPKGVGLLYARDPKQLLPLIHGGGQEMQLRSGTPSVPAISAFGYAVELLSSEQDAHVRHIASLRQLLREEMLRIDPDLRFNGDPDLAIPTTLNVSFSGVDGPALMRRLDVEGIAVSTGSACSTGSVEPSPILLGMGLPHAQVCGAIRISLGKDTTRIEIDHFLSILPGVLAQLRQAA